METIEIVLFVIIFIWLFLVSSFGGKIEELEYRTDELENNWEEKFGDFDDSTEEEYSGE